MITYNYSTDYSNGSVQIFTDVISNEAYMRNKWSRTKEWSDWNTITNTYSLTATQDIVSNSMSANDMIPNRVYTFSTAGMVADLPENSIGVGTILTFNYSDKPNGQAQFYVTGDGKAVYSRIQWSGKWYTWIPIYNKDTEDLVVRAIGEQTTSANTSDADDLENNRIYIVNDGSGTIKNLPEGETTGCLMCYNYASNANSGKTQIFVSPTGHVYTRVKWGPTPGTWYGWHNINDRRPEVRLSMFTTWGAIGDSFISGVCGNYGQFLELSWVQNLARQNGVECTNYSTGGLTTETWLTNSSGLTKLQADEAKKLYIVALGINDAGTSQHVELGSLNDMNTTPHPNTFYGNMATIYEAIKNKNSSAVVVYVTIPRFYTQYIPYSEAIRSIASHYGCLCIDSDNVELFHSDWWIDNLVENHPTAAMYSMMASAYQTEFSHAVYENPEILKEYVG